jgi:dihydroflavonol-4-reductase
MKANGQIGQEAIMILVTGAAGHLGNVLVRELIARGEHVRVLILPGEDTSSLNDLDVEWIEGNILDEKSLEEAFMGMEKVYHLASIVSITPGQEEILRKVNIEGTKNVLNAAKKAGIKRLVYTSSIHALTRPPEGVTIDETLPFDPDNPAGAYDATKAAASLAVLEAVKDGLNAVIVCPTGVIGPHDYRRSEMGEMLLEWMGKPVNFMIEGFFDFVDVRDVAVGHILACEKGKCGQTYILGGERIHIERMCRAVKEFIGLYAYIIKIPLSLALFVTPLTEVYYRLTHQRPRFTRYSLETITSNSKISSAKARKELGYHPRSLLDSIQDTVTWWQENRHMIKPTLRV